MPVARDTSVKDTQTSNVKPSEQNHNISTMSDSLKKKKGFFRRLFGKKTS